MNLEEEEENQLSQDKQVELDPASHMRPRGLCVRRAIEQRTDAASKQG